MIVQGACTIFFQNLLSGLENFAAGTPDVYKLALYTADASLDSSTLAYTSANEVVGTGYTAGGVVVTPSHPATDSGTGFVSFSNAEWTGVSFVCRGALIYNANTGAAIAVLNFGSDKTGGPNFTVAFPPATASNAIIQIS